MLAFAVPTLADTQKLPQRSGPTPTTTNTVPHVQIGVNVDQAISAELLLQVSKMPGVRIRDTIISMAGAKGFWIDDDVTITQPQVIVRGREFAHMHPDGSLHASLSPELAEEAVETGWATYHPWANQRPGWDGFVMIYTPNSKEELDVVIQIINNSYDFITGRS